MQRFEAIVFGLGAMGSAALYHLARTGSRVLGIDQFSPPHAFGSSHGDTRITRLAIGEGEHYTPLAIRSHQLWRELERESGKTLLTSNGGLVISSLAKYSITHVENFFDNTVAAARRYGIAHETLDAQQIRRRFPQFNVADDEIGYFEPKAGFLRPEECVSAHLTQAALHGDTIRTAEKVSGYDASRDGVTVTTERASYAADRLIIAAGPWLPEIIGGKFARCFRVYRQALFWFDIETSIAPFLPASFPVFIWELQGRNQGIYGFPALDGPRGGVKIATEQFAMHTSAASVDRAVTREEMETMYEIYVAPFISGLGRKCVKAASCLYTVTPDFGFVIDSHPESERILIVSPCSGHGFKHSPAVGEKVAEWAIGRQNRGKNHGAIRSAFDAFKLTRFSDDAT
jgi:sarcosine oxidase